MERDKAAQLDRSPRGLRGLVSSSHAWQRSLANRAAAPPARRRNNNAPPPPLTPRLHAAAAAQHGGARRRPVGAGAAPPLPPPRRSRRVVVTPSPEDLAVLLARRLAHLRPPRPLRPRGGAPAARHRHARSLAAQGSCCEGEAAAREAAGWMAGRQAHRFCVVGRLSLPDLLPLTPVVQLHPVLVFYFLFDPARREDTHTLLSTQPRTHFPAAARTARRGREVQARLARFCVCGGYFWSNASAAFTK